MLIFLFIVQLFSGTTLPTFGTDMEETMYLGVENMITVDLKKVNPEDIKVKVNSGTLYKKNDSVYVYIPQEVDAEVKIKLYYQNVICDLKIVTIKVPAPLTLAFDTAPSDKIKLSALDQNGKWTLRNPNTQANNKKTFITSFNIYIRNQQGISYYSATVRGEKIDEAAIKVIKSIGAGATILCNNFQILQPNNNITYLNEQKELTVIE